MQEVSISPDQAENLKKLLLMFLNVLLALLLLLSATAHSVVYKSRPDGTYQVYTEIPCKQLEKADTPIGIVNEYRFQLAAISHADTLAFYINHHNIEIYVADRCVYRVTASEDAFGTPGGTWTMLPLYASDAGAQVRVVLAPLYENYQKEAMDFLLGSELAIYKSIFYQALPELLLSLCVVFTGFFLLFLALYHTLRKHPVVRLYKIGFLAVAVGVWRFTYEDFAYLLFEGHSVFNYNLSVLSLMMTALALLNCVEFPEQCRAKTVIRYGTIIYSAIYAAQLLLQLAGILDLRQMLKLTHLTIVVSALLVCINSSISWIQRAEKEDGFAARSYLWLLGVGVLLDLFLYYVAESSVGMLCTLGAILCFSLLEGVQLLVSYTDQKNALQEMEVQLTLSRTTTMMSQIRSHFVFNLLNAVSGMCKYDPAKADDTVVRFARYLRNNIDIMENDKNIPFSTDLKQLEDYVILEQVRFGDKLEFYTDIETEDFLIPPLIMQPVVENAIKHGISKKQTNGTIILRTRDAGDHVVITVEDDGVGFAVEELEQKNGKSVGLKNIRFRLHHLVNGTVAINSQIGIGTTVTICIPKEEEKVKK